MSKRSKRSAFSVESLQDEVRQEINQETLGNKLSNDIKAIDLNFVDHISVDVLFCAVLIKFGLSIVSSFANVASALCVLPIKVRGQVLQLLHPELSGDAAETLFNCTRKMDLSNSRYNPINTSNSSQVHVFSPPCSRCFDCNASLVGHNDPIKVQYHHHYGTSEGIKVSLKCSRCKKLYGYSKYGNPESCWNLYPEARTAVEASDVCFVERSLLKWQISLA